MRSSTRFPVVVALVAALFLGLTGTPVQLDAAPVLVGGKVTEVTLYQGQALITRSVELDTGPGGQEVVITDLPQNVVPDSLFAEGGDAVDVRAVRFRTRAVGEEPREEVRKLDEAIEAVQEKIELNRKSQEVLTKRDAYLDKLEGFVAPTAELELSRGVLDAKALETITLFSFEQRKSVAEEQVKLGREAKALQEELNLLQRKRAELTRSSSRTVREAVVFLEKDAAGRMPLRLNYLVNNCGWSPSYVFRAAADGQEVRVEYNALVQQMTGEDWDSVALTLSTASPALSAASPGLAPFYVSLGGTPQPQQPAQQRAQPGAQQADLAAQVKQIRKRQAIAVSNNLSALNLDDQLGYNWDLNSAANDFQCLELIGGREVLDTIQLEGDESENGPSISYRLSGTVSLASRSDQQMVRILESSLKSHFYHVATPVLSSYVYREAELTNGSQEDLLGGPITAYLDGKFVGRAEIPTVTRGETFVVGFGADPQLRTRRELVKKDEGVQGGNREIAIEYALSVENYSQEAAKVRLFDRLPYSSRTDDIRITLSELQVPLSEDKVYQRRERPKGILRWDIDVAADSTGEEARALEYGYKLEYDRKYQLSASRSTPQIQQEFQQMQKERMLRK